MKTLHLTLKKKWFDMILSGKKTEEYREIKTYWENRLIDQKRQTKLDATTVSEIAWIDYDTITFKNGYSKNAPEMTVDFLGIEIGTAKPEWSDNWHGEVFKIKLGKILSCKYCLHTGNITNP